MEHRVTLKKLFELVIRDDPSVITEIRNAVDNSVDVFSTFGFSARKDKSLTYVCDCLFDFEQFGFIKLSILDETLFQTVLDNIIAGKCVHVTEDDSDKIATGIGLIHAAAATGNVDVLRCLITLQTEQISTVTSCGLQPIHIGTLHNQARVVVELVNLFNDSTLERDFGRENKTKISYKDLTTETVQVFKSCEALLTRLLATLDNLDDKIKQYLLKTNLIDGKLLLIYFIEQKRDNDADQILTELKSKINWIDKWLIVKCILLDYDTVVSKLLRFTVLTHIFENAIFGNFGTYNGCTPFEIATTFGSAKCIELLKEHDDDTNERHVNSNASPYTLVCKMIYDYSYPSRTSRTSTESMNEMNELFDICKARGYDINKANHKQKTPLLYAIYKMCSDATVIQRLLKDGADVNLAGDDKTPLEMAVRPDMRGMMKGCMKLFRPLAILKSLLFGNPYITQTPPSCFRFALFTDTQNKHLYKIQNATSLRYKPRVLADLQSEAVICVPVKDENKTLAASRAALLFECGYEMTKDDNEYLKSNDFRSLGNKYSPYFINISKEEHNANVLALSEYFDTKSKTVRSLKSTCRNVLRNTYPGPLIYRYVQLGIIPKSVIEYLLLCKELGSFEYEIQNTNGEKKTFALDNQTVYSEASSNTWLYCYRFSRRH